MRSRFQLWWLPAAAANHKCREQSVGGEEVEGVEAPRTGHRTWGLEVAELTQVEGHWGWEPLQYLLIIAKVLYSVQMLWTTAGEGEGQGR